MTEQASAPNEPPGGYPPPVAPGHTPSGYPPAGQAAGYQPGYPPPGQPAGYPVPGQGSGYLVPGQPVPGWGWPGYPPPVPSSPDGQPLAAFWERLLAYLIDGLIIGGASAVVVVPAMLGFLVSRSATLKPVAPDGGAQPLPTGFFVQLLLFEAAVFVLALLLTYVYFVELMFRSGQTVGKRVMRLRVVPLDPAARLDRGMAVRRYLIQSVAAAVVPFLTYLDGLWQLWDKPYHQCLHDKFARTVVVKLPY